MNPPKTLDELLGLSRMSFLDRGWLPNIAATYFVIFHAPSARVAYVGKAEHLCERWAVHHRIPDFELLCNLGLTVEIAWLEVEAERLSFVEAEMIAAFRPALNSRATSRVRHRSISELSDASGDEPSDLDERSQVVKGNPRFKRSTLDALFPQTRQRVISILFGQSEQSFGMVELIRLAGMGSGAVQREVERLTECGLVTVSMSGRYRRFQANSYSPLFEHLRAIVTSAPPQYEASMREIADDLTNALRPISHSVQLAILFGSVAAENQTPFSDIDLLLVADNLMLESIYGAMEVVERKWARRVSPTVYRTDEFIARRDTNQPFLARVLEGPHVLLLGNKDTVAERSA